MIAARPCCSDIAILTGGTAVMKDLGVDLEGVTIKDLGQAKKLRIDGDNTTIIEGARARRPTSSRASLRSARKSTPPPPTTIVRSSRRRLAKLAGGVAQINVGAATETEMKEKKARIEDALHATRAAVEEGIVPGGGVDAWSVALGQRWTTSRRPATRRPVWPSFAKRSPSRLRQIAINAGEQPGVVLHKVQEGKGAFGYNALTGEYTDLVKAGVIDPAKVVRTALENASSVAPAVVEHRLHHHREAGGR